MQRMTHEKMNRRLMATGLPVPGMKPEDAKRFSVKSVDKWNNIRK